MARALMPLFITPAFYGLRTSIYIVLISVSKLISVSLRNKDEVKRIDVEYLAYSGVKFWIWIY